MRRILSTLGEDATHTRGVTSTALRGLFTRPYQQLDLGASVKVTGAHPTFAVMTADLPSSTGLVDDTLVRAGVTYTVKRVEADDPSGITVFELKKVA